MQVESVRESIDRSKIKPEYRAVLDWICRQPARVYDFSEIAEALKLKRGFVEKALTELKHQRCGCILSVVGPFGEPLRSRHAYLPASAPIRKEYPALEHPELKPAAMEPKPLKPSEIRSANKHKRKLEMLARRAEKKLLRRRADLTIMGDAQAKREERLANKRKLVDEGEVRLAAVKAPEAPKESPKPAAKNGLKEQKNG
jgi:hypothetical protein